MLTTLNISNFAIVENLDVEFRPGLNVITGETGAGKSIMIGALSLLVGERADKSAIRTGEAQASVEAAFLLREPAEVNSILVDAGIDECEVGQLLLRRIVSATGSSRIFINGCSATLQVLKSVGNLLVDMHGPHDHQSLLSTEFQMDILDAFGGFRAERTEYEAAFKSLCALRNRLAALDCDESAVAEQIDFLEFQVNEIKEAGLAEGEEEDVKGRHTRMANAQDILQSAQHVDQLLVDGETSVLDLLAAAERELASLRKMLPESEEWSEEVESASIQLRELARTISDTVSGIEDDPKEMEWLEDRLALYSKMRRKYGASLEKILKKLEDAEQQLDELKNRGERIAEIEADIQRTKVTVLKLGKELGAKRRAAGTELESAITDQLQDLGFSKGAFYVQLSEIEPCSTGTDEVEFGFAPNVGEEMRPLRTIASSGEISRVMLATKAVLAIHDRIPLLVFDEIDANVGGEMGFAIGTKLSRIAGNHQVICITHLPQVAVHGCVHFGVSKDIRDGRTFTDVAPLCDDDRVGEVARMLGGSEATSVTVQHARELLAGAQS